MSGYIKLWRLLVGKVHFCVRICPVYFNLREVLYIIAAAAAAAVEAAAADSAAAAAVVAAAAMLLSIARITEIIIPNFKLTFTARDQK